MSATSPGPWCWEQDDHGYDQLRDTRGCLVIESRGEFEVSGPDSRLIAAAPELLEILDYILDHSARMPTRIDDWWRETEARADALIHRIRGTTP